MSLTINAKPRTITAKAQAAMSAISTMRTKRPKMTHSAAELKVLKETEALTVIGYEGGFYAVVSNDDLLPEVLAVSDAEFSDVENPGLKWWMESIEMVGKEIVRRGVAPRAVPKPMDLGFSSNIDAIVQAEWDQDTPYWNMCPKKGNSLALTGCVATAIAQVLYTHKTPINGHGSRTNTSWSPVTFDYDGYTPDYSSMIDKYTSGPTAGQYTDEQVEPMAKLMLACGVAVNMDYSPTASGAYTNEARDGLVQYMGIETADFKERDYYSDEEWMSMVYAEIDNGHAMYYSGVNSGWGGGGHAFVCDGYDEDGKVHINWGWSGKDNGMFNIDLLNPTGYQFSLYQDFIMGLWDPNDVPGESLINLNIETTEAGQLESLIAAEDLPRVKMIKVSGPVNNEDVQLMRKLATGELLVEGETEEENKYGHLRQIDLSDAQLEVIPEEAFKDAVILRSISLPRNLAKISSKAFQGCTVLQVIRSYVYNVPSMGSKVFDGVNKNNIKAMLIAGSSESYLRNAQWKTIISKDNVTEFGTCIKAGNKSVYYGTEKPKLSYSIVGESVIGHPEVTTEYDETCGVGKYAVTISLGTITEDVPNLVLVDGVITVMKASLTVKAEDAVREQYQENPEFVLSYDGFKNEETAEVAFTELPVVTTSAVFDSPAGEYPITVSGGDAPNYSLKYVAGTLTVVDPTAIVNISADATDAPVYDLQGRRVTTMQPGTLYIKNGRKTLSAH